MSLKSGFFQSNPFATLLRGAALAMVLIAPTLPAHAEVVTLVCQAPAGNTFTLRIDYDQKTASLMNGDGSAYLSASAEITDAQVWWNVPAAQYPGYKFNGRLNRLSGVLEWLEFPGQNGGGQLTSHVGGGLCRRATQKF